MNFELTNRKEKDKKYREKEVKTMKKLGILVTALLIVLAGTNIAFALWGGGGTGGTGGTGGNPTYTVIPTLIRDVIRTQTTLAITNYNKYGMAIGSRSVTTSTTETYVDKDLNGDGDYVDDGEVNVLDSTVITESTAETQWISGSLKTSSVSTISTTFRGDDTTTSSYTDSYAYDADGNLTGASGSGNYYSIEKSDDGTVSGVTVGTITRTFGVKDGQALLLSSITEGSSYGKDVAATVGYNTDDNGNITGIAIPDGAKANSTFTSGSVIRDSDYSYLGGSWVQMLETQFSESNTLDTDGVTVIGYNHSAQQITYTRDANGIVTGMDQNLLYSDIKSVTGKNTDGTLAISYSYIKPSTYSITSAFDSEDGWYISSETTETALGQAPAGIFAFSTWDSFKAAYGL